MAHQDWRLRVQLAADDHGVHLVEALHAAELAHEARKRFGDRVVVSRDGADVFLYADTEGAAREAERVVREELEREGRDAKFSLDRWHPTEESWEDASQPLPETERERDAEHEERMEHESHEAEQRGYAEFEVRIELPSWGAATNLSERLDEQGLPHVRRFKYILLGAENEDAAQEIADRMRGQVAGEAEIRVEGSFPAAQAEQPFKPFAIFGN